MPVNFKEYNLKLLRKDRNLSQDELSEILGVRRSRLSRIENYKERLSYEQVIRLMDGFEDFDIYEINISGERKTKPDQNVDHFIEQIKSLKEIISIKDLLVQSLMSQIELLKNQNFERHKKSGSNQPINFSSHSKKGKFVNWNIIDIPSHEYKEVVPGIFDRIIMDKDHALFDWESIFSSYLSAIDFSKYKVILNYSNVDTMFSKHFHVEKESIICVSGTIHETLSNTIINEGDSIQFESMQAHEIVNLTDTKLIILLEKPK